MSSVTKNTSRYADTYRNFYITVNFAFNLPHYVTIYIHHTGKKESKKENRMTIRFSPCCTVSFQRLGKTHVAFTVIEGLLHDLSPRNEENNMV